MRTSDWLRRLFVLTLGALALLIIVRDAAMAKGPADKVTINGTELTEEIEVAAAEALQALSIGQLEDFKSPIAAPSEVGPGYEVTRYYKDGANFIAIDHVRYHPDPAGGRGYVFYIGLVNGWSQYDGKWFRATAQGEQALQRILAENGGRLDQAAWPVPLLFLARNAEQHAIWLVALGSARSWLLDCYMPDASSGGQSKEDRDEPTTKNGEKGCRKHRHSNSGLPLAGRLWKSGFVDRTATNHNRTISSDATLRDRRTQRDEADPD